jgi:NAD(P)-dependent dehydrogenase (short-subunit alcohol dehydrogenase family)
MDLGMRGKVALITGGSDGIGLAIGHGLAAEGVDLVLSARVEGHLADGAKAIAAQHGVKVVPVAGDVSRADDVARLAAETERAFGGVDILINNAGTGSNEKIADAPDSKWQYYWDLQVMAAVRLARALGPSMKKRGGGVILHNASICAKQPLGYEPIYNVTKAALMMFSKCLSEELARDNIRVNCVNPGLVLTRDWIKTAKQLTAGSPTTWQQHLDKIAKDNAPVGRFATPEEIANLFVFLASPQASYCTGSTYGIDGGWLRSPD